MENENEQKITAIPMESLSAQEKKALRASPDWRRLQLEQLNRAHKESLVGAYNADKPQVTLQLLWMKDDWDYNAVFNEGSQKTLLMTWAGVHARRHEESVRKDIALLDQIVQELLDREAYLWKKDKNGDHAISMAIAAERDDLFDMWVQSDQWDPENLKSLKYGPVPNPGVTKEKWIEQRKQSHYYKEKNHDLEWAQQFVQMNLLDAAISMDLLKTAKGILDQGININQINDRGRLPISYCKNAKTLQWVLEQGGDFLAKDAWGKTATDWIKTLDGTVETNRMIGVIGDFVKKKMKKGGAGKDNDNEAIMEELRQSNLKSLEECVANKPKSQVMKLVKTYKYDIKNIKTSNGSPLLKFALRGGKLSTASWLIEQGALLSDQDAQGNTLFATFLACNEDRKGISKEDFMKTFAKESFRKGWHTQPNHKGWTPVMQYVNRMFQSSSYYYSLDDSILKNIVKVLVTAQAEDPANLQIKDLNKWVMSQARGKDPVTGRPLGFLDAIAGTIQSKTKKEIMNSYEAASMGVHVLGVWDLDKKWNNAELGQDAKAIELILEIFGRSSVNIASSDYYTKNFKDRFLLNVKNTVLNWDKNPANQWDKSIQTWSQWSGEQRAQWMEVFPQLATFLDEKMIKDWMKEIQNNVDEQPVADVKKTKRL